MNASASLAATRLRAAPGLSDDDLLIDNLVLRMAIIRHCALDEDAVAAIHRLQGLRLIGFGDAAVRLGYATQADIDRATNSALTDVYDPPVEPAERLLPMRDPFHPRSEQIRTLRTELLLRHEDNDRANIIAVLSPRAAEGRSQLAADLAISFAQLGQPTLLVDADLRNPQQHLLFNAANLWGLSHALARGQKPHFQAVKDLPALSLLTAGKLPPNPLELLSGRCFEGLVREWEQSFQFVVIDTPPVGQYADGLAVATIVGRVLSLSRAAHTPYKETRDMLRRLAATRSRVLGAVVNHF